MCGFHQQSGQDPWPPRAPRPGPLSSPNVRPVVEAGWAGASPPPGMGVYLSVILRPDAPPERLMHLTCAVAEVLCDGVEAPPASGLGIKWTNDLVSGGRKLCGILTELSLEAESGHVQYAVVGAGVNCGQKLSDFPRKFRTSPVSHHAHWEACGSEHPGGGDDPLPEPSGWIAGGASGAVDGPVPARLRHHWTGRQCQPGRGGKPGGARRWTWTAGARSWWTSARARGRSLRRSQCPGHVRICIMRSHRKEKFHE